MSLLTDIFASIEDSLLGVTGGSSSTSTGDNKGPTTDIRAGDIIIQAVTLMSEDGSKTYDLLTQCKTIEIFESIVSPVIFAELGISDPIGLYQSFPIHGEEYVSIKFKTPGSTTSATYLFRVNKIKDKEVHENTKTVKYTLQLASAELIRNATAFVNRSYNGNIHDIVENILNDDLMTSKPISIDATIGIEQGMITNMQPFKAIDFLRKRAVSSVYQTSAFVFYESRDGYVFTTIEALIKLGKTAVDQGNSDKTFFFDTTRHESISTVDIRNIVAYNQISFGDTVTKAQVGAIYNETTSFDLITGTVKKSTFKNDGSANIQGLDDTSFPVNTSGFINKHSATTSTTKLIPTSSALPTTQRVDRVGILTAYAHTITQNIVQVYVYGDSELRIGDVIKCNFPAAVDTGGGLARLESGNYLVAKVRHMILNSDRPQHMISMELIKGNFVAAA